MMLPSVSASLALPWWTVAQIPANAEEIEAGIGALRRTVAAVHALDDGLIALVGRNSSPSFDPLLKSLDKALRVFDGQTASAGEAASGAGAAGTKPGAVAAAGTASGGLSSRAAPAGPSIAGEITSLDDVRSTLAKIRAYYEVNEPSSPVPLLLLRAERLVGKNFLDLLSNLMPTARAEFSTLMGPETE